MYNKIGFLVCGLLMSIGLNAQTSSLTGNVKDEKQQGVAGATITVLYQRDSSLITNVVTANNGTFQVRNLPADSIIVTVSSLGFQQYVSFITLKDGEKRDLGDMVLTVEGTDLGAVVIIAKAPPVTQKGDTAQYSASQYKVNPDATAEDLIKKMPGITVDQSGTVTAQGEQVRSVTVDGKKFFGDDATAALKNLPAEIVDKIQVFDKLSDQAQFTGVDDGSGERSINIVTKSGVSNGQFGRLYAGYGTEERYTAGGNVSFFKGDRRISIAAMFNNINQQNFSTEDLLGVTGSGGGGRRGGGRGGGFGGQNNFLIGQASGISTTNSIGINYTDKWSPKLEVNASIFLNKSNTDNNEFSYAQYFIKDSANQYYDEANISDQDNFNNRINFRMEYKLDSNNSFIFSPYFSFQDNDRLNSVTGVRYYTANDLLSKTLFNSTYANSGYNSNNNFLWRHRFSKPRRTLSVNLSAGFNKRTGESYLESINEYFNTAIENDTINQFSDNNTRGYNLSTNISYTEPVGKKGMLQFSYSPYISKTKSDQEVFQYDYVDSKYNDFDTTLSNVFDNKTTTHTTGITYRTGDRNNGFSVGVNYRYTNLYSEQTFPMATVVDKSFNNLLPTLMFRRKLSEKDNIRLFYRGYTSTPSISQLQNVIDNSNPLFLKSGNPELQQAYTHMLSTRYTYTNTKNGTSFFANLYVRQSDDYIGSASYVATSDSLLQNSVVLYKGAQLTKPVNMDGYLSLRSFLTYGRPLNFIKTNLNVNGGFGWAKTPGIVNNIKSVSDNYSYSGGIVLASNWSEYIDFTFSYNANYNVVRNTVQPLLNTNYLFQSTGVQINLLSKNGWFIQQNISNQNISGLSAGYNQNYWLWSAAVGKKFLKNQAGELKLSVFDLLKQNQSISRNVTESYMEDVSNSVLTQYFMLTFSYKLRNFGKAKTSSNTDGDRPYGPPPGGGPGGPSGSGGFRPF